ncbi:MAG TPA: hypothetical protein VER33_22985 [Polyangiaceae bacterium]|nr:hypothetical protein [Polyangiaceae bacterium]
MLLALLFVRSAAAQSAPAAGRAIARPAASTQTQKTAAERGVNPCNTPDPGFGQYERWSRGIGMGQMLVPKRRPSSPGGVDVVVHFHGHEPARKEWVHVMDGPVLVGIDLGLGSGPYETAFAGPDALKTLLDSVERQLTKRWGKVRLRNVALSAWSAGYGAVQGILSHPRGRERVDAVILLDGLHCGYRGQSLNEAQLRPFMSFSELAAGGEKLMVVTHSSIIPPGYASTTETANFLVRHLGGRPQAAKPRASDPMGLELISRFSRRGFHLRGFAGNDKLDHCAHLGLLRDILTAHLKPRGGLARVRR